MLKSKILVAAFVLLFLIGCSKETKSELPKKLNQELNSKTTQQNFDNIYTAALEGDIEIIRLSIPEVLNANANSVNHVEKWTALMNAAEGQMEVVKLLLQNGADTNLKDIIGDTAESFALNKNHLEVSNFLKKLY